MKLFKTVVILLLGYSATFSNFAMSQNTLITTSGSQYCQPMNLNQALQGIQWRSTGIENASPDTLWVVCPVLVDFNSGTANLDWVATNTSDVSIQVECLTKVNSMAGDEQSVITNTLPLIPGEANGVFGIAITGLANLNNVTLSCKLPPGARLGAIAPY